MAPGQRPIVRRNPPVNRSTNRNNVDINSGIDTQMLNPSDAQSAHRRKTTRIMQESFRGTEGAVGLTRWFEKLESQFGISNVVEVTLDTAHATPWNNFKAMFIRKYCPRNEVKQMENEL
ncbi:hypothetical protein Tco_0812823 [Tanacetum coccineum]